MGEAVDSTLSVIDTEAVGSPSTGDAPVLYVVLEASRPLGGGSAHSLADIDVIEIGRGTTRSVVRDGNTLTLTLPDRWMSSRHARIENRLGRWVVSDCDSKNGTSLGGTPIRSQAVADGALIGVGHSFLRFRIAVPLAANHPADVDSSQIEFEHESFSTLLPTLASELSQASRLAQAADIPFLIRGESGTGKEVLARAVHELSGRRGELIAVNCGAIPANLVESELFGHVRGAFSGALENKVGLIRAADGGTLLLDEIGDLPLIAQTSLLRVLQEREVHPVGSARPVPVDLRILSATHRDLDAMVAAREFRGDLYARLAGYSVSLPALRDRSDDVGVLINILLRKLGVPTTHPGFSVAAAAALVGHAWPMNIRELEATLRSALALAGDDIVGVEMLPASLRGAAQAEPDSDSQLRERLETSLATHRGNLAAVARDIGKDRKQIQRWVKRFAINLDRFRL